MGETDLSDKRKTIVIGDDESSILDMLSIYVKGEGFNVETYDTGERVYERLQRGRVDHLIVDGSMNRGTIYTGPRLIEIALLELPEEYRLGDKRATLFTATPNKYPINEKIRDKVNIVAKPGFKDLIDIIKSAT